MVKCVDCNKLNPEDLYCSFVRGYLDSQVANREYDACEGYEARSGEGEARSGREA